jgi:hydroxymethylglutaryl-CoA lyase
MTAYLYGFGNHIGDPWNVDVWVSGPRKSNMGVKILSLQMVGSSTPDVIAICFYLIPKYPDMEFGAHLHYS